MITIYSDDHRLQAGRAELIDGVLAPCHECPARADAVLAQVREVGLGEVVAPTDHGTAPLSRVHAEPFLTFLRTAHDQWRAEHGDTDALPLSWPVRGMTNREPETIDGRLGYFSFDAGTPITAGTWRAARAAADVALSGAERIANGAAAAFALCRPPGHHAGRDVYGGYCFLNNAAIATQALRDGGAERIAILDVDYHHGNGTQSIFEARSDVLFVSLHGDPAQEYPYFSGYGDETGVGSGEGFSLNLPMRWGANWATYAAALEAGLRRIAEFAPTALVISLGVDTYAGDPISRFRLGSDDYSRLGERIAGASLPTLFVLEGGYALQALGANVVNVLAGFEQARG